MCRVINAAYTIALKIKSTIDKLTYSVVHKDFNVYPSESHDFCYVKVAYLYQAKEKKVHTVRHTV